MVAAGSGLVAVRVATCPTIPVVSTPVPDPLVAALVTAPAACIVSDAASSYLGEAGCRAALDK